MSGDYYIAVTSQFIPKTVNHYRPNEAFALFRIPETFKNITIFSMDLKRQSFSKSQIHEAATRKVQY